MNRVYTGTHDIYMLHVTVPVTFMYVHVCMCTVRKIGGESGTCVHECSTCMCATYMYVHMY